MTFGSVETLEEAERYAARFKEHRVAINLPQMASAVKEALSKYLRCLPP